MAEYVYVYHDTEERHRSTFHDYENVSSLVHAVIEGNAPVLIVRDGNREKRFIFAEEPNGDN